MGELVLIFTLLGVVAALAVLANGLRIPYPILLVLGGLGLAFVPGTPRFRLEPDLVFLLFLPPLLFAAAYFTSWRDLWANARPVGFLAVGLVLATTLAVAVAGHALGLPWAAAFVLGAVVSPTDAVAATAIAQRLGVPRRVVTVLEGESLVNDATGLVAFRVAASVAAGTAVFSVAGAGLQFVVGAAGGVLLGVLTGWLTVRLLRMLDDPLIEAVVTLLVPFLTYILAEEGPHGVWHELLGLPGEPYFSGVLAVVTAGLVVGRKSPVVMSSSSRLEGRAVWDVVVFLLNGLAFILIGLQLPEVVRGLEGYSAADLARSGVLISLTVVLVRLVWVFPAAYLPRLLSRRLRERDPYPAPASIAIIGWAGMRGVVSLAAALSLPLEAEGGAPFPERSLILFLTFCVILTTLVLQGLSLPPLIRFLGLEDDGQAEQEEVRARVRAAEAALRRLGELETEAWVRGDTAERVRGQYNYRRDRFLALARARFGANLGDPSGVGGDEDLEGRSSDYQRLLRELVRAQRGVLLELRDGGEIADEALRRVEHDLDLEEARLDR